MKAMIFAAGLGTRLKPFTENAPKALAIVAGKPLLEHAIRYLQQYDIHNVVVNVHHFAAQIEETLNINNGFGSKYEISDERVMLLETGGGLLKAAQYFEQEETIVVLNADIITSLDLGKIIEHHKNRKAAATLAVMNRTSSRQLLFDENMKLCGWQNVGTGEVKIAVETAVKTPFAFSGIQVLNGAFIAKCPLNGKFSMIDWYLKSASEHQIIGYDHSGDTFIDVGKPDSIAKAEALLAKRN